MLTIKEYRKVSSLEEAYELNQKKANRIVGGMLWMKMQTGMVNTAIDLSGLGLNTIEETDEEFRIGCMTSLRDLELHPGLNDYTSGAVREALHTIVGVQFRNLATVGGSIYGRFGFSDVLTVLMALDSYVELYQGGIVSMKQFAARLYDKDDRDILVRVIIRKTPVCCAYLSHRSTKTDFPLLACAVSCLNGTWQAVIGARPHRAALLTDDTHLLPVSEEKNPSELAASVTPEAAAAFADYVKKNTVTGTNSRASKEYRSHLAEVLVRRALLSMGGDCK